MHMTLRTIVGTGGELAPSPEKEEAAWAGCLSGDASDKSADSLALQGADASRADMLASFGLPERRDQESEWCEMINA